MAATGIDWIETIQRPGLSAAESRSDAALLGISANNDGEAETCLHQALDIARRQQARSLELRAAMSLGRLWQRQGKRATAHELLSAIYGWFTEL